MSGLTKQTSFSRASARSGALSNKPINTGVIFMTRYRSTLLTASAASLFVAASGCTDLKPVQAQLDDLKAQISQLSPKVANADNQALAAAGSARSAASSAQQAKSTADKANATAQTNQQAIEAINEKIDRMFKKKLSK
jgi:hypothetical protein